MKIHLIVRIGIKGLEEKWVRKTGIFSVKLDQLTGSYSINGSVSMSPEAEKTGTAFTVHTDFASSFKYFGITLFLLYKLWGKKGHDVTQEAISKSCHNTLISVCYLGQWESTREEQLGFISSLAIYTQQFVSIFFSGLRTSFTNILQFNFCVS